MARDFDRQLAEFQVRVAVLNGYTAIMGSKASAYRWAVRTIGRLIASQGYAVIGLFSNSGTDDRADSNGGTCVWLVEAGGGVAARC